MTENEAVERLVEQKMLFIEHNSDGAYDEDIEVINMSINALEKAQQFKAIGTVERLKNLQEDYWKLNEVCKEYSAIGTVEELQKMKGVITDFPIECGSPISNVEEIWNQLKKYLAIGTIEEFKALKEKSVAKKPNQVSKAMDKDKYVGLIGRCPNCGSIVAEDNFVCEDCFQVLDWK